jgi:antitoxin ParD1/3/4
MRYTTLNISMPPAMKARVEEEVASGSFASTSDFIRDLIRDYMEDKRIESLVLEGLKDRNVSPLTKKDFVEMKRALTESFKDREKEQVS